MAHASAADPRVSLTPDPSGKFCSGLLGVQKSIKKKSIKNLINFRSRFWTDLGLIWGSKTTPFGDQNRPKISPRPVLRRLCFKNVVFQNVSPALGESTILTLLGSQDGTKIDPRSPQDRLEIVLKGDRFLRRFLIDFWLSWAPFWLPFWHPRWVQKKTQERQ